MKLYLFLPALLASLAMGAQPAQAQGDFRAALSNPAAPATLSLSALDSSWQRLRIKGPETGGGNPMVGMMSGLLGMFGVNSGALSLLDRSNLYYTQGKTLQIGSETFLIGYQPRTAPFDAAVLQADGPPAPEVLTPQSQLQIVLINVRSIALVSDVRAFNLQVELKESAQSAEAMKKMMESKDGPAAIEPAPAPAPAPKPAPKARPRGRQP